MESLSFERVDGSARIYVCRLNVCGRRVSVSRGLKGRQERMCVG